MKLSPSIIAALVSLAAPLTGFAQTAPTPDLTSVAYPVADLVVPLDHRVRHPTCERELIDCIQAKVASRTWEKAGGAGTIRYIPREMALHVRQTAAVHKELASFLMDILLPTIAIETRLMSVPESVVNRAGGMKWRKQDGVEAALIDEIGLYTAMTRAQESRRTHIMQAPKVAVFDRDVAEINVAEDFRYIAGLEKRTEAGEVVFEPKDDSVKIGFFAKYRPTLSRDRKSIALDLSVSEKCVESWKSTRALSVPLSEEAEPRREIAVRIKTPVIREWKVTASATIPDRRTLVFKMARNVPDPVKRSLLADVPFIGELFEPDPGDSEPMLVLLFVSVRVIGEEHDDEWNVGPLRNELRTGEGRLLYSWRRE